MKAKKISRKPVSAPLVKDLDNQQKVNFKTQRPDPTIGSTPLKQSDLYHDPGNGYNANSTFPQD